MSVVAAVRQLSGQVTDDSAPAIAGRRFFDAANNAWMVKVFPGEFYTTNKSDEVLVTILGSCVSACIRDPRLGIGGMNHFMLAEGEAQSGVAIRSPRDTVTLRWKSWSTN